MEFIINSKKYGQHTVYYDDEDHELIAKYKWSIWYGGYGYYVVAYDKEYKKHVSMHRLLMGFPSKKVDHKNCIGTDNRKSNLRLATDIQSSTNRRKQKNNKSGYKGVYFVKAINKYRVELRFNKKKIQGGYYDDIVDAAKKYNELAIQYQGEFANINELTNEQNNKPYGKQTKKIDKRNKLGFRGITKTKYGKYHVTLSVNKKLLYIGVYITINEAVIAYNENAVKYFGENAILNNIPNE